MALYGNEDQEILKFWEEERIALTAQVCKYYSLRKGYNVDPLLGEAMPDPETGKIGHTFRFMFEFEGAVTYQQKDNFDPTVREEGKDLEYDAELYISRNEWDRKANTYVPKEDDVVEAMGLYFDVVKAGSGGNIVDTTDYTGYALMLKRRDKFTPERKV